MTEQQFEEILQQVSETKWDDALERTRQKAIEQYGNLDSSRFDVTFSDELYVVGLMHDFYLHSTPEYVVEDLRKYAEENKMLLPFIFGIHIEPKTMVHWVNKEDGEEGSPRVSEYERFDFKPSAIVTKPEELIKPIPQGTVVELREFKSGERDKAEVVRIDLGLHNTLHRELKEATGMIGDVIVLGKLPNYSNLLVKGRPLRTYYSIGLSSVGDVITESMTVWVEALWI